MDNLNYLFYEEFTKLNRLCTNIYQVEGGVAGYIAEMSNISSTSGEKVPRWNEDLEMLCRHHMTYSSLTQSADAFQECLCTQEEIAWIKQFYARIMDRKDPLALLQVRGYCAEDDVMQRRQDDRADEIMIEAVNPRDRYVNGPMVVWVIVGAVVLTCLVSLLLLARI